MFVLLRYAGLSATRQLPLPLSGTIGGAAPWRPSHCFVRCERGDISIQVEVLNCFGRSKSELMAKIVDWDDQIGRRLRLRDLRVFFAVVQHGSLAKAAAHLRVSQPAVSQVIAELEHSLGAKLFDRSSRGVEPTIYATALLSRGRAAFDELKQGIRDIESLIDPEVGEVRIGCTTPVIETLLPDFIHRFSRRYPRIVLHVEDAPRFGVDL